MLFWSGSDPVRPATGGDGLAEDARVPGEVSSAESAASRSEFDSRGVDRVSVEVTSQPSRAKQVDGDETGWLTGRVVDFHGNPLAAVRVFALPEDTGVENQFLDPSATPECTKDQPQALSDAGGRFRLAAPSDDDPFEVVALSAEFLPHRRSSAATGGHDVALGDLMLLRGCVLEGNVLDEYGKPVVGAVVSRHTRVAQYQFFWGTAGAVGVGTGRDGAFRAVLEWGEQSLVARHDEFLPANLDLNLARGERHRTGVVFRLGAAAVIEGRVVGVPPQFGTLSVRAAKTESASDVEDEGMPFWMQSRPLGFARHFARVADDGSFRLSGLTPEVEYRVAAFDGGGDGWANSAVTSEQVVRSGRRTCSWPTMRGLMLRFRSRIARSRRSPPRSCRSSRRTSSISRIPAFGANCRWARTGGSCSKACAPTRRLVRSRFGFVPRVTRSGVEPKFPCRTGVPSTWAKSD